MTAAGQLRNAVASVVADRGLVLSLITGGVALVWADAALRGSFLPAGQHLLDEWHAQASRQPLIARSSLIAVAGFARVPVQDAVRALTLPVLAGLAISTFFTVVLF